MTSISVFLALLNTNNDSEGNLFLLSLLLLVVAWMIKSFESQKVQETGTNAIKNLI